MPRTMLCRLDSGGVLRILDSKDPADREIVREAPALLDVATDAWCVPRMVVIRSHRGPCTVDGLARWMRDVPSGSLSLKGAHACSSIPHAASAISRPSSAGSTRSAFRTPSTSAWCEGLTTTDTLCGSLLPRMPWVRRRRFSRAGGTRTCAASLAGPMSLAWGMLWYRSALLVMGRCLC
jgi:hypothetical protein